MNFKYIDRAKEHDIVLLPGWATDWRIFENLNLDFNYLIPEDFNPHSIEDQLLSMFKKRTVQKISILGWSMGGFAAANFTAKYKDLVDNMILVGVKERYEKNSIDKVKGYLTENKKAYLYKFYRQCFSDEESVFFDWFSERLMKDYIDKFDLENLLNGLDYLLNNPLNISGIKNAKIKFVWGLKDKIVALSEIEELRNKMPQKEFAFIDNCGHLPFLNKRFKALL